MDEEPEKPRVPEPFSETKSKRKMKTASQLMVLEKTFAMDNYPTETLRAELSVQLGLSGRQLQMWFCHRRLKDRRPKTAAEEVSPAAERIGCGGDDVEVKPSQKSAKAQLGEKVREDGPILGVEFDPLLLGECGMPIGFSHKRKTSIIVTPTPSRKSCRLSSAPKKSQSSQPVHEDSDTEDSTFESLEKDIDTSVPASPITDSPAQSPCFRPIPLFEIPAEGLDDIKTQLDQLLAAGWEDPIGSINLQSMLTLPSQPVREDLSVKSVSAAKETLRRIFSLELPSVTDEIASSFNEAIDVLLQSDLSPAQKLSLKSLRNRVAVLCRDYMATSSEKEKVASKMNDFQTLNTAYEAQKGNVHALTSDVQRRRDDLDRKLASIDQLKKEIASLEDKINVMEAEVGTDLETLGSLFQKLKDDREAATSEGQRLKGLLPHISSCRSHLQELEDVLQGYHLHWSKKIRNASCSFL